MAKVSSLIPVFKWFRYVSLQAKVRLSMEMKMKSVNAPSFGCSLSNASIEIHEVL